MATVDDSSSAWSVDLRRSSRGRGKMAVTLDIEQELWRSGFDTIAGVDEAGRGPLAGPVVAAAVIFDAGIFIEGVDDSKKLSEHRREELALEIHRKAHAVGIGIADHVLIDEINILQATMSAMYQALEGLAIVPAFVLVDGKYFRHPSLQFRTVVHGDALSHTIAAASIIAKTTRDRLMRTLDAEYPGYGFSRNKGYGTKEHVEAIRVLGRSPVHRRSFRLAALHEKDRV
jgi:ribonuclease HII